MEYEKRSTLSGVSSTSPISPSSGGVEGRRAFLPLPFPLPLLRAAAWRALAGAGASPSDSDPNHQTAYCGMKIVIYKWCATG